MIELSQKANEISALTRRLLTTGGYKSFSYADIADVIQIRKASIHHHFPSKADLIRTVVIQYREEALAGMSALDQQLNDPVAEIKAYVDYWSRCIKDGSSPFCICMMLAVELPSLPDEVATEVKGHFQDLSDWLTSLLQKGQNKGIFRLTDTPSVEAKSFMATVHGAMLAARAFNNAALFQQITQPVLSRLLATDLR
ncbi:TetR/AcrR family transcriptional regulator [Pantoea sp. EA-12]|uniref:TetR/AcrR family transcriptional regulator n=1 Tax=Pantoea sp. EA-12 TaxID=3043303 RepID=UPI0024B60BAE|nr:TetR/AcrR family transcriptional regulator [Pantoea sp. EA-12]MDI9221359.1 TetR/AcrR family transcriptional regulator [Pantoea sp. EA-12]